MKNLDRLKAVEERIRQTSQQIVCRQIEGDGELYRNGELFEPPQGDNYDLYVIQRFPTN